MTYVNTTYVNWKNVNSFTALLALTALSALPGWSLPPAEAAAPPVQSTSLNGKGQVVPSLKGLVFLSRLEDLIASGSATPGVTISSVKLLNDGFKSQMAAYVGHPLSLDGLNEITHAVVTYYREQNHPLVDAVVPAQNVESGVIQIVVTEFRVGKVLAQGNRWFSDRIVMAPLSLQHGDTVDSQLLINQLDAANTNPFRRVNLVYRPAAEPGYTDLVLQTQDRLPLRVYTGFDNSGTPVTGRNRWELGATWGNALWRDQQLSYQFSSSTDPIGGRRTTPGQPGGDSFIGHSLTWSMSVRGRDSISILGGFQRSAPSVGQDFGLEGLSGQASFRYSLALRRTGSLIHTLQAGYDFKTTNNNLQFGGTLVSRTNAEINQLPVIYAANMTDKWGSTALTTAVNFSPGRITGNNNDQAFQPATGSPDGRSPRRATPTGVPMRLDSPKCRKVPYGHCE